MPTRSTPVRTTAANSPTTQEAVGDRALVEAQSFPFGKNGNVTGSLTLRPPVSGPAPTRGPVGLDISELLQCPPRVQASASVAQTGRSKRTMSRSRAARGSLSDAHGSESDG